MRATDPLSNPLFESVTNFLTGNSPKLPKQETVKMPKTPTLVAPKVPAPVPVAAPPTASTAEVGQAQDDERQQAARRNGIRRTLVSGETGGYSPEGKKNTLG